MKKEKNIDALLEELEELKAQLFEANSIIEAIKEGSVDALVLNKGGKANVYSLESADYTYRILIEKFGEGALSISDEGLILYCNDYFAKMIDLPHTQIIGTYINSYVDSAGQFHQLKNDLSKGPSKGEITLNINGKKLPIYLSLTSLKPMVDAIGIVVTDLSEKRKHEEALALYQNELEVKVNELHQTNTDLEQFVHVISHDIKEPLRKILAYTSQLTTIAGQPLTTADAEKLKVISKSASKLHLLIDDLSKYIFNDVPMETNEVDLNLVLNEVLEDLELLINENEVTICIEQLPRIMGTRAQIRQLFSNLLTSAIKYRDKNGGPSKISITTELTDCVDIHLPNKKYHKISLHDDGVAAFAQSGEPFSIYPQLPEGNGKNDIGFSICKKIMENHLGKMDISINTTGFEGNVFNFYFPIK